MVSCLIQIKKSQPKLACTQTEIYATLQQAHAINWRIALDKETALRKLAESRKALLDSTRGLNEADLTHKAVEGTWATKDLLAHITSWEVTVLEPLRQMVETGSFEPASIPDHLAWNDQQALLWQNKTLAQIYGELETTRQQILTLAAQLQPAQWEQVLPAPWGGQETLAQILSGLAWHEMEHLKSIHKGLAAD